jgi:hypothetical protein
LKARRARAVDNRRIAHNQIVMLVSRHPNAFARLQG